MDSKKHIRLDKQVAEIKEKIRFKDNTKASVSSSTIGWQLDHALKVINLVSKTLLNSNPEAYKSKFNKWRMLLFTLDYIPRGKVKAPKIVRPPEVISIEDLNSQLQLAQKNIEKIKIANNNAHFKHFIFGVLNKKRTIRFLEMHTKHHLKIVSDILKK